MKLASIVLISIGVGVSGCAGSAARQEAVSKGPALTQELIQCTDDEAKKVAPQPVDLLTAGYAVRARCSPHIRALRANYLARFPGFSDEVRRASAGLEDSVLERAMAQVALNRTRR